MKKFLLLFLIIPMVMFCGNTGDDITGGSSETSTGKQAFAAIEGLIVFANNTPVVGAGVKLRNQADVRKIVIAAKMTSIIRSGFDSTDITGFFRFDTVDTGKYWIAINYQDSLGALAEAAVTDKDTVVRVNATLRAMGTIQGKIDSTYIKPGQVTYIYIPELGIKIPVDSNGVFSLPHLPPGNYTIMIIIGSTRTQTPTDSVKIPVIPGDTTLISKVGSKTGVVIINGSIIEPK
jgi:hypothetical protein